MAMATAPPPQVPLEVVFFQAIPYDYATWMSRVVCGQPNPAGTKTNADKV